MSDANTALEKVGANNVTLTGRSTHGGTTMVREGTLTANGATLGTGTLTVARDARLVAKNTAAAPLTNKSVNISGEVLIGTDSNPYTGALYLGGADATFGTNATLKIGVRRAASRTSGGGTCLMGVGRLTFKGTLEVVMKPDVQLQAGDSIRVWQAERYAAGSSPRFRFVGAPGEGLTWDTSRIAEGLLLAVPDKGQRIDARNTGDAQAGDRFTLCGLRATKMRQGIYIHKGKKIAIK